MLALQGVALGAAGLLRRVIKLETRGALDVVVASISEGVVRADKDRLAASWQLHRGELLLVVLLECRSKLFHEVGLRAREGLDVCSRAVSVEAERAGSRVGLNLPATTSESYAREGTDVSFVARDGPVVGAYLSGGSISHEGRHPL